MTGAEIAVRTPVIAGNWKMHKGPSATREFFARFLDHYPVREDRTVIIFPPAVSLAVAADLLPDRADLYLGVQNIHGQAEGAFTGETSAPMAQDAGARFALVGHSERRHIFHESDAEVRGKVAAAFDAGLIPVLCVGETLEQRETGRVEAVILEQLRSATEGLAPERIARLLLAYEPVWAIGTGIHATPADAAAAHAVLRRELGDRIGAGPAEAVPILYGGSVKISNAAELLAATDVDGLLVGGASLDPDGFATIANG